MTTVTGVTELFAQFVGLATLAGTLAAAVAIGYRWYVGEAVPPGLALLVGLGGVAVYLNTTATLRQVIDGLSDSATTVALLNITAFATGAAGGAVGRWAGDRFAAETAGGQTVTVDDDVGRLVRTVGQVVTVTLPADIDDAVGYDPVADATKETLAGRSFVFPRRLTVPELRERLVERLTTDYEVGHVDVDLAANGTVQYLALGARAAGIGPTLTPATNAVAIRADPAFAASAGDVVQVWETDPMHRVCTAELRGVNGDVATVAIDAADTRRIDPGKRYRLVTLPVEDRPDREFASLLRAARETFSPVTVAAGSPLHGLPAGALDPLIVAVEPDDRADPVEPLPDRDRVLRPGDRVFAIATPEALRRLAVAAEPLDPARVGSVGRRQRRPVTGPDRTAEADVGHRPGPATASPTDGSNGASDPAATGREQVGAEREDETPVSAADVDTARGEPGASDEPAASGDSDTDATEIAAGAETDDGPDAGTDASESGDASGDRPGSTTVPDPKTAFELDEADRTDEGGEGDATDDGDGTTDVDPTDEEAGVTFEDDLGDLDIDLGDDESEGVAFADENDTDDADDDLDPDGDDDLAALSVEGDGESEGVAFADENDTDDADDDLAALSVEEDGESEDENGDGATDGDDDGGAPSFADLKKQFESGEADWADEIDDSPGGDMRLDE